MSSIYKQQWQLIKHDKWLLSCLTWLPVIFALSIWWIFSQGIARDLPIGVVDLQHSQLSRTLTQNLDASPTLAVVNTFSDVSEAKRAMIKQDIYGYVIIPTGFDKAIYQKLNPQVSAFYNSQFILIGKLFHSAVLQVQGTFAAELEVMKVLSHGDTTTLSALGQAVTVQSQITPLFNKNTNYAQFLISAVVPALWQIMMVVSTILVLNANHKSLGLSLWLGHKPLTSLCRTMLPYIGLFSLLGTSFLLWFYLALQWPMNGSFTVLIIAQIITAIACVIMGSLFFFLTLDPARAMSFAGAFTAPSFAFMGITFPVSQMNELAQMWRSLLPISHYIEVQVEQSSYGVTAIHSLHHMIPMLGYLFPVFVVLLLTRKHLRIEQGGQI
ncbi:ABC transporter permease [Vibrio sp. T187]|uniref:ABC transporter permease n=1 Tax=Vibrio TaxID=662 RepID=UPI0010CA1B46|nr:MULTISPECIES: ABC transporter permease [Vibrio]MBW3696916.1 ABC transporter permease [Vibrio sp. T187]